MTRRANRAQPFSYAYPELPPQFRRWRGISRLLCLAGFWTGSIAALGLLAAGALHWLFGRPASDGMLAVIALLSGCNPDSGLALIEVSYPSGYVRTSTTWDEVTPVEEAEYQLRVQKAEDYDKTYHYDLQILDGAGDLLSAFSPVMASTMRCFQKRQLMRCPLRKAHRRDLFALGGCEDHEQLIDGCSC